MVNIFKSIQVPTKSRGYSGKGVTIAQSSEGDSNTNKYVNTNSDQLWRKTCGGGHLGEWRVWFQ